MSRFICLQTATSATDFELDDELPHTASAGTANRGPARKRCIGGEWRVPFGHGDRQARLLSRQSRQDWHVRPLKNRGEQVVGVIRR